MRTVRCVLTGRYYISPELTDRLARGLGVGTVDDARHEALSPREFQVFRRLALGESVSRIARALDLSIKTVDTHRRRIFLKMGMDKREDLARYAFERGLIPSRRIGEQDKATHDDG